MGQLHNRVAVVTGAGGGLGREHALLLAAEGATVVVNDLHGAQAVVDEIRSAGGEAVAVEGSVADMTTGEQLVAAAVESFGDLHVIVNNAGVVRDAMLWNMTEDQFDLVVDVHLKGAFGLTRAAGRFWREQSRSGASADRSIVNTTSAAGLHGNVGQWNYAAAKAGLAIQAVLAAEELADSGSAPTRSRRRRARRWSRPHQFWPRRSPHRKTKTRSTGSTRGMCRHWWATWPPPTAPSQGRSSPSPEAMSVSTPLLARALRRHRPPLVGRRAGRTDGRRVVPEVGRGHPPPTDPTRGCGPVTADPLSHNHHPIRRFRRTAQRELSCI